MTLPMMTVMINEIWSVKHVTSNNIRQFRLLNLAREKMPKGIDYNLKIQ
jgi:hypothetical protein